MAGYTRQSTFADGDTITAALFNNEYNQLLNAFSNTGGHKHDGTAAEGPVIGLIGDAGVTTPLNKVLIDSTNDHIEFWIEVSSSAVQQLYIADGAIVPVTDNDIDLGTSSLQFKDLYINGTANIDSLVLATGSTVTAVLDEDDLSSDSATSLVTQQSVKAYIDAQVTAQDLDFLGDSGGALSIDLDSESLTIAGGTGLDTVGSSNTITINIDATVATLTGTQTLTNKTIDVDNNTVSNIEVDNFKASAIVLESEGIGSNDNDTSLPTSAAVKDYVDTQITAEDLDITTDSGTIAIDLDSETLTVSGGTGLDSSATGNAVTLAIDSTVTTLTGTQTLTNKTLTTPVISSISNTGTLTLPTSTDTLVGRATTDTLTNKTLTSPVINTGVSGTAFLDDDTFGTATASTLASSESIKAYVDTTVAATNEVVEDTTPQLGGTLDTNGNLIQFGDSSGATDDRLQFGASQDLSIYHDGSNSYIADLGDGVLKIGGASQIEIQNNTFTENMAVFKKNGAVELYYDNALSLATTSTGIDVTGTIVGDGLTISSATANVADLRRANNAGAGQVLLGNSDGHVRLSGTNGSFDVFNSGNTAQRFGIANNGDISFYEDTGSTQALFWDASAESLGIGTTSPSEKLHVLTTGNTIGKFETTTTSDLAIELKNSQGSMFFGLGGGEEFAVGTTSDLNGAGNLFTIKQDGNVGIGTTSPSEALHVYHATANVNAIIESGDANAYLAFKDNSTSSSASVFLGASANDMTFFAGGTTERMRIDSSGNVGIGTDSPSQLLSINSTGSGERGISFDQSGTQRVKLLYTNSTGAFVINNTTAGYTSFENNGEESARINNSGNLLVGTTDSNVTNNSGGATQAGINLGVAGIKGYMAAARYQGAPLALNRLDNDGDIAVFTKDGATVGSIGTSNTRLHIGSGDVGLLIAGDLDNITPWNSTTGASRDAAVDLGNSGVRFKDLYLSGEINAGSGTHTIGSGTGTPQLVLLAGTTAASTIDFGDSDDGNIGRIEYTHSNDSMTFRTNNSERMRIDSSGNLRVGVGNTFEPTLQFTNSGRVEGNPGYSFNGDLDTGMFNPSSQGTIAFSNNGTESVRIDSSGNLLVGKTDTTGNVAGISLRSTGLIVGTVSSGTVGYFNRTTDDGTILDFRKDNAAVGSIGTTGGDMYVGTGDTGIRFDDATNHIRPCGVSGANLDATIDIGDSTRRFKDLYLSGGVQLGGSGAANKLDDYEEGTWTPASPGVTLTSPSGTYTKVGRLVTVTWQFVYPTTTDGSQTSITGLPFTVGTGYNNGGNHSYVNGSAAVSIAHITAATTSILYRTANGGTALTYADFSGATVRGSMTYMTA